MEKIAFHMGLGLQRNQTRPDRSNETAADHDLLSDYTALESRVLAKNQRDTMDVALNLAVKMDLALRRHIASDHQFLANC
jgi:hypothetical protein